MKSITNNQKTFFNQVLGKNNIYDSLHLYSDKFSAAFKPDAKDLYKQHKVPRLKRRLTNNGWR